MMMMMEKISKTGSIIKIIGKSQNKAKDSNTIVFLELWDVDIINGNTTIFNVDKKSF